MFIIFEYECPECGNELTGGVGDDVHCYNCGKTFETDWDTSFDSSFGWIVSEYKCNHNN